MVPTISIDIDIDRPWPPLDGVAAEEGEAVGIITLLLDSTTIIQVPTRHHRRRRHHSSPSSKSVATTSPPAPAPTAPDATLATWYDIMPPLTYRTNCLPMPDSRQVVVATIIIIETLAKSKIGTRPRR